MTASTVRSRSWTPAATRSFPGRTTPWTKSCASRHRSRARATGHRWPLQHDDGCLHPESLHHDRLRGERRPDADQPAGVRHQRQLPAGQFADAERAGDRRAAPVGSDPRSDRGQRRHCQHHAGAVRHRPCQRAYGPERGDRSALPHPRQRGQRPRAGGVLHIHLGDHGRTRHGDPPATAARPTAFSVRACRSISRRLAR